MTTNAPLAGVSCCAKLPHPRLLYYIYLYMQIHLILFPNLFFLFFIWIPSFVVYLVIIIIIIINYLGFIFNNEH